jgi:hypothetical protein
MPGARLLRRRTPHSANPEDSNVQTAVSKFAGSAAMTNGDCQLLASALTAEVEGRKAKLPRLRLKLTPREAEHLGAVGWL